MHNIDKFKLLFQLIEKISINFSRDFLVEIWNIDNFISAIEVDELTEIIKILEKTRNVKTILFSQGNGFILNQYSYVSDIIIFNELSFRIGDISSLKETIERNYPIEIDIKEIEIFEFLKFNATDLFNLGYMYKLTKADVIIKLLNDIYSINCKISEEDM